MSPEPEVAIARRPLLATIPLLPKTTGGAIARKPGAGGARPSVEPACERVFHCLGTRNTMNREEKAQAVEDIAAQIKGAEAIFAIDYRGISVPQAAELRSKLREA